MNEEFFGNMSETEKKKGDLILSEIMGSTTLTILYILKHFEKLGFSGQVAAAAPTADAAPKEEKSSSYKLKIKSVGDKVKSIPILKGILGQNTQISVLAGFLKEDKMIEDKTFSTEEADKLIADFAKVNTVVEKVQA